MEEIIKKYWNDRPCNIRHSSKEFKSFEYFEEIENKRYFVEPHIKNFCEFKKYSNKKVLEIGCGIGTDAIMFAKEGCEYYGIELSNESLNITKERFKLYNLEGQFFNINAEDMSIFKDNYFDLVYSFGVIHHTENPEKVIDEIHRILKPEGEAKIMLYSKDSWKNMMINLNLDQYEAQSGCPIAYTYTKDDIYNLFDNFKDININQYHIFPYKIEEYKNNEYIKVDYFKNMPDEIFEELKNKMGWHLCISCKKETDLINKFYNTEISTYPWKHILISNLFNKNLFNENLLNENIWKDSKHFINEYANKKEINNINIFPENIKKITEYLISPQFVRKIEKLTEINDLIIDRNIYGGGITISNKNSYLNNHIDFNYNDDIKMYRAVNLILYLNDVDGGEFELYNLNNDLIKSIDIKQGNILIFSSNNKTIHGFNKIKSDNRISLNLWYYTKIKSNYVDYNPHRTIWIEKKNKSENKLENKYLDKLENLFNSSYMKLSDKLNNFTLFTPNNVISKFLVREELFKKILNIHGSIVEIGVANGIGVSSFQHLSMIYEPYNEHRPIYGFDNFEGFINFTKEDLTTNSKELFIGNYKSDSEKIIYQSGKINNEYRPIKKDNDIKLIKGDIIETVPEFINKNNHLIVSLLYLDCDLYEPTKVALKYFINRMPKGSVIAFDELAHNDFPGETNAYEDILGIRNYKLERFERTKVSYIVL